ncbi:MAG: hypothetical protein JSR26_12090 [Proteobacteria bacterium]|nr:hypothetical protein [Pseudomonadota bacterium]
MHQLQALGERRAGQALQALQQGRADRAHAEQGDADRSTGWRDVRKCGGIGAGCIDIGRMGGIDPITPCLRRCSRRRIRHDARGGHAPA